MTSFTKYIYLFNGGIHIEKFHLKKKKKKIPWPSQNLPPDEQGGIKHNSC